MTKSRWGIVPLGRAGMLCLLIALGGPAGAAQLSLVYSGNLNGELEPCGCSAEGNLGGIKRRATMLKRLRAQDPDLFAVSAGGLLVSDMPFDRITSAYILSGMARLGYDAVGVQWRDLAYGTGVLAEHELPWVASNWREPGPFQQERRITRGGTTLAFFQWLDPRVSPQQKMGGGQPPATEDADALAGALARAKGAGAVTVLATTLALERAQQRLPLAHVDILIIRARPDEYGEPREVAGTVVLEPGTRGMYLGRLNLELDGEGRIAQWRHEVIAMPPSVPDDPDLAQWYEDYNAELKQDYERRVAIRAARTSGQSPYAGAEACASCHGQAHEIWQSSRHAGAFEALAAVNKQFDPNCVGCHSVGFNREGGFIDSAITPHLQGVQCESCHGAARAHVSTAGQTPVAHAQWGRARICAQCHNHAHSPGFDIDEYWPRIAHGRGEEPAAR